MHYISTVTDGMDVNFSAWTMFDLQFSWNAPWNGTLSIGARNLAKERPPLDPNFGSPSYTNEFYDVYGRVPYVKYKQDL